MKRRQFLARFGLGVIAALAAPTLARAMKIAPAAPQLPIEEPAIAPALDDDIQQHVQDQAAPTPIDDVAWDTVTVTTPFAYSNGSTWIYYPTVSTGDYSYTLTTTSGTNIVYNNTITSTTA